MISEAFSGAWCHMDRTCVPEHVITRFYCPFIRASTLIVLDAGAASVTLLCISALFDMPITFAVSGHIAAIACVDQERSEYEGSEGGSGVTGQTLL